MIDYGYISLSLGAFSVAFDTFNLEDAFPRILGEMAAPQFSATKTLIAPGNPYGEPEQWAFEAVTSQANAQILLDLYREHRRLTDTRQDGKILLIDTVLEYSELAPRTRAKAPTPFDTETASGGYTRYYGQFYAVFQSAPEVRPDSVANGVVQWAVNLALIETGVKVAP